MIILRRPLLMVFAAEQAWLLWCLKYNFDSLLSPGYCVSPDLNCLQEHKFEFSEILKLVVWMLISLSSRGCWWTVRSPFLSPFLPQLLSDGLDRLESRGNVEMLPHNTTVWLGGSGLSPDWNVPVLMNDEVMTADSVAAPSSTHGEARHLPTHHYEHL